MCLYKYTTENTLESGCPLSYFWSCWRLYVLQRNEEHVLHSCSYVFCLFSLKEKTTFAVAISELSNLNLND